MAKRGRPKGSKNKSTKNKELRAALGRARAIDVTEFKNPRGRPRKYPVGYKKSSSGRGPGRPPGSKNKSSRSSSNSSVGQRVIIVGRIKLK